MKKLFLMIILTLLSWSVSLSQQRISSISVSQIEKVWPPDSLLSQRNYIWKIVRHGNYLFGATGLNGGVVRSTDGGRSWSLLPLRVGLGSPMDICITTNGTVMVGNFGSPDVYVSTDFGNSWKGIDSHGNFGATLLALPDGSVLCSGQYKMYKSTDNGNTWIKVADSTVFGENSPVSMFLTKNGTVLTYVAGLSDSTMGIFRSTDGGLHWVYSQNSPKRYGVNDIEIVAYSQLNNGTIYGFTRRDGLYKSTDDGINWEKILPFTYLDIPFFSDGGGLLASDNLGLFLGGASNTSYGGLIWSPDYGQTWQLFMPEWKGYMIGAIVQLDSNRILINANGYLYILTLDVVTKVENSENQQLPSGFDLKQNYPNPFNPTTTIEFQIPERSFVKLTVFNALGQEVAVLVNEEKQAGIHRIQFNGSNLPTGVYFYRLETPKFIETKKMILVK
jgi:photosystem II stability/assembly factor-like uncharacterized protein